MDKDSTSMIMIVGELKGLAADLRNTIANFNNHTTEYREDQKDTEQRLSALEKLWENHSGKIAGVAIASGAFGGGLSLFFACHMGYCH